MPLLEALEREFRRMSGVTIAREAWQLDQVPEHLKMTFRVVDGQNKRLEESKSLADLQLKLKGKVRETLSKVAEVGLRKTGANRMGFWRVTANF